MALRSAAGILAKASLVGANTVKGPPVLSVSPRSAAVTAATRVDNAGLLLAAVATGSCAMPLNEPEPLFGTAAHPSPVGTAAAEAPLLSAIVVSVVLLLMVVFVVLSLLLLPDEPPLLPQAATRK